MKKLIITCTLLFCGLPFTKSQTIQPLASGFGRPVGISLETDGYLYVTESGTGMDDGRVVRVDSLGTKSTLVYGLPSYLDTNTMEVTGAWRSYLHGTMLWVVVGGGPSPDAGKLLKFDMTSIVDSVTVADTIDAIHIQPTVVGMGYSESNIYSVAWKNQLMYVADAGANAVLVVDSMENITILDTFPAIPNPVSTIPPFIDYVPTKIIPLTGGEFYLCNLTGFPFVQGISSVERLDTAGNHVTDYMNLSQAVDMQMDSMQNLYVLQFGSFDTSSHLPITNSASILRIMPGGSMDTVAMNFGPSAGITLDGMGGFYATQILTGNVIHILPSSTGINLSPGDLGLSVYPNPFTNGITLSLKLDRPTSVNWRITDLTGRTVVSENMNIPQQVQSLQITSGAITPGMYILNLKIGDVLKSIPIVKQN